MPDVKPPRELPEPGELPVSSASSSDSRPRHSPGADQGIVVTSAAEVPHIARPGSGSAVVPEERWSAEADAPGVLPAGMCSL